MTVSLRERRKQQTARDIQIATLELAAQKGLDQVTTEEIAAAAGVSTRTFFNYFVNKESAAIGTPPPYSDEDKTALCEGNGPLHQDLKAFLNAHIKALTEDAPVVRLVGNVLRSNEKARGILDGFLMAERESLTEDLTARVKNKQLAAALSGMATDAIGRTIFLWEHSENLSLSAALDIIWEGILEASKQMAASSE
ncbi:TetR family transcriptional regulator [Alphaproteobacteria bacterium KMM 3653]|uniref:TetR family transcriptional regulator n=1 Tax=Harenicola maris TaxID=2841044 RepID=A0AAP2G2P6_9RHOB|nr:TetR family transcriptional regulator [Harenicola maris]